MQGVLGRAVRPSRTSEGGSPRVVRRVAALVVAVLALLLSAPPPAGAHTEVTRSDPPNGGMVPEGATTLRVWFDEPVGASASTVRLRTQAGRELPATVELTAGGTTAEVHPLTPLARGTYVLDWHVLSLTDGHSSSGTVVFGAGLRPAAVAAFGSGLPSPELLVLRWVTLVSLMLATGSVAVCGRVLEAAGVGTGRLRGRVRRLGATAAWCGVYAGALDPLLRTFGTGGSTGTWAAQVRLLLLETAWGRWWIAREVALVVAAVALTMLWRRRGGTATVRVGVAALVAAAAIQSWAGHASSLPSGGVLTAAMDTGHILAAGVWVGGLAVLVAALSARRSPTGRDDSGPGSRALWRAYSPRAAVATVVLVATGVYQAGHYVPSAGSAAHTPYGVGVLAKAALLVLALGLAGLNTLRVDSSLAPRLRSVGPRSWAQPRHLRLGLSAELAVLGLALLAAGLVSTVPTAREVSEATRPSTPRATSVDGLYVTVEALAEPGQHLRVIVRARSTVRPEPAPVGVVTAELSGPAGRTETVTLTAVDPEHWEGRTPALAPGTWRAVVRLNRTGQVPSLVTGSWTVAEPGAARVGPLQRVTSAAGVALLLALIAALVLHHRRRTTPHLVPDDEPVPALEESRR